MDIQELHKVKTYFTTIFYPNFQNKEQQIVIEYHEQILEEEDVNKGYIEKEILFDYFGEILSQNNITRDDINENSVLCEYTWSDEEGDSPEDMSMTKKIMIK